MKYFVNHETYKGPELPEDQWQKPSYEHYRFGGFIGGPIKRDKAHFFLAYDGLRRTDNATITSPWSRRRPSHPARTMTWPC